MRRWLEISVAPKIAVMQAKASYPEGIVYIQFNSVAEIQYQLEPAA